MSIYTIRTIYYTYNSHMYTYSIRAIYMHILIYTCIYVHILCDLKNSCIHAHNCPYLHIRTFYIRTHTYTCNIHAYTCIYLHLRASTICRICTYLRENEVRICTYPVRMLCSICTYMHVLHVYARSFCTESC